MTTSPPTARDPLPAVLRGLTLAILALVLVLGLPAGPADEATLPVPPELVLAPEEVGAAEWPSVLRHAAEGPVRAVVSGRPPPVRLDPPRRVQAGRTAALRVAAYEPVRVVFERPEGAAVTTDLPAGEEAALLLRPFSEGWRTWRVRAERPDGSSVEQAWSALVEPARSLRILAISGPPDAESRTALRALDEAGEEVEAWIHLGRDRWVGRPGGALPSDPEAYAHFDVVLLFPAIELGGPQASALATAVEEHGAGLLMAATDGGSAQLAAMLEGLQDGGVWRSSLAIPADELEWDVPPEITPLPPAPLTARTLVPGPSDPNGPSGPDASPIRVAPLGRGRIAALGLTDSWRWRMEAGLEDAHRAFWTETAAWLAGGFQEDPLIEVLGADTRAGDPVVVRRIDAGADGEAEVADAGAGEGGEPEIVIQSPDARQVLELLTASDLPAGRARLGAFLPVEPGAYTVAADLPDTTAAPPPAGVIARPPDAPVLDPAGRLARIAVRSPGGSVMVSGAGATAGELDSWAPGLPWRTLLFGLLAVLLPAEWARRRLAGRP